ncbi:MAG TPA: hypothetical protein VG709_01315 [Actinomycetota bacterium]|nr:hypothetical protein [Actinomycetota bacterium]
MYSKVKVRGQAVVAAEPDDVHLVLEVTALEEAPDRAFDVGPRGP